MVDANGNQTQTSGDGTTSYSYDRSGRLTGIDYSPNFGSTALIRQPCAGNSSRSSCL